MGLFLKCINQTRKPEGTLGKLMLKGMNFGHAKTADWGMGQLEAAAPERIAEIGCVAEVCRILKLGGCFLVVNESDGQDEAGKKFEKMIDGMKLYTAEEIGEAMKSAGFTKVKTVHHGSQPWIAVLAEK